MNIFIAGGSGAIGRSLVPMLVRDGHRVVAMTRSADKAASLEAMGAQTVVVDVYDEPRLIEVMKAAKPDVVIHQLTAFGATQGDPLAETLRVRTEGTRNLVLAAVLAKARRFITQSISFVCTPLPDGLATETTSLYLNGPGQIRPLAEAIAELEARTMRNASMEGIVLRYGWFYGPGTNYDPNDAIPRAIRKGKMPIVGDGAGTYSFIHVDDAAAATVCALTRGETGIYNIVDDDPAPLRTWLPVAASLLRAPAPQHIDAETVRAKLGDLMLYIYNEQPGVSNAKAKRELGWQPTQKTWREGFKRMYTSV